MADKLVISVAPAVGSPRTGVQLLFCLYLGRRETVSGSVPLHSEALYP